MTFQALVSTSEHPQHHRVTYNNVASVMYPECGAIKIVMVDGNQVRLPLGTVIIWEVRDGE